MVPLPRLLIGDLPEIALAAPLEWLIILLFIKESGAYSMRRIVIALKIEIACTFAWARLDFAVLIPCLSCCPNK